MKKLIVILIVAILSAFVVVSNVEAKPTQEDPKKMQNTLSECTKDALLKGYGWSALYGAGVMTVGAGLGIALAPVTMPVAVVIVGVNGVIGASIGIGSSAVTRISDQAYFDSNPLIKACINKLNKL